jgi:hypothetical protein
MYEEIYISDIHFPLIAHIKKQSWAPTIHCKLNVHLDEDRTNFAILAIVYSK